MKIEHAGRARVLSPPRDGRMASGAIAIGVREERDGVRLRPRPTRRSPPPETRSPGMPASPMPLICDLSERRVHSRYIGRKRRCARRIEHTRKQCRGRSGTSGAKRWAPAIPATCWRRCERRRACAC